MTTTEADRLVVAAATVEEWSSTVTGWAADEGWNPGHHDVRAFFAQDPAGFFLGRLDGEPVSAVSVVTYGPDYAFLGFYLVRPELRGRGLGLATWRAGLRHAGNRTVGLDGVPAQQHNYRASGFELAYHSARYRGIPRLPPPDGTVRPLTPADDLTAVHAYDSACLPADRPAFLTAWLAGPGHHTVGRIVDGTLTGYAVVRPARDSARVGPLFADTPEDATHLLSALAAQAGGPLAIDVPLYNEGAVRLVEQAGLRPGFETARMYTGPVRDYARHRVYGATTLELG